MDQILHTGLPNRYGLKRSKHTCWKVTGFRPILLFDSISAATCFLMIEALSTPASPNWTISPFHTCSAAQESHKVELTQLVTSGSAVAEPLSQSTEPESTVLCQSLFTMKQVIASPTAIEQRKIIFWNCDNDFLRVKAESRPPTHRGGEMALT